MDRPPYATSPLRRAQAQAQYQHMPKKKSSKGARPYPDRDDFSLSEAQGLAKRVVRAKKRILELKEERDEARSEAEELRAQLSDMRKRLNNVWKIVEQTHVDPQARLVKIRRQIPTALSQYNPFAEEGSDDE